MNILDTIIEHKRKEVAERKRATPTTVLEESQFFSREVMSLRSYLTDPAKTGIIAEFKRRSPSKGVINDRETVEAVTRGYAASGASCLSVLTDEKFFGGTAEELRQARINNIPILPKQFLIDKYQIIEARAMGADVILFISACFLPAQV